MTETATYPDFAIQTRPEIRKGCVWDISLLFSLEALKKYKLSEIYLEKPRVQKENGAYLCLKVRSKLIQKEIGFGKVGELEHDRAFIEPNSATGSATLKVKFTQRPRAVFHKHADVMVLVISLRSCTSNEVLLSAEHELIFRGGTGSMHSADSRKKAGPPLPNTSSYAIDGTHTSHSLEHIGTNPTNPSYHLSNAAALAHAIGTNATARLSRGASLSARPSLSAEPAATPTTPLVPPYSRPTPQHIAFSEAVTRAHPQAATLFPSVMRPEPTPGTENATSSLALPTPSTDLFFFDSGSFLLDGTAADFAGEPQPEMEVQTLTLDTIHEFQQDLQDHCNQAPTFKADGPSGASHHVSFSSSGSSALTMACSDEFDFSSSLSPNTVGLAEDSSNPDLEDARELDEWAKAYGLEAPLFDAMPPSMDIPVLDATAFAQEDPSLLREENFDSHSIATSTVGSSMPPVPTLPSISPYHTMKSEGHPETSIKQKAVTDEEQAGAVTRARSARVASKKRAALFDPEGLPLSKQASLGGTSNPHSLANHANEIGIPTGQNATFEEKVFQKLFFRSLTFLSLEELRVLAQSAPLPIFVKDDQGAYLLANPSFCSFVYDDTWEAIAHRRVGDLLDPEESERVARADEYIMAREGSIGTFYLSIRRQDFKIMKLYTKLRDCPHKLVVGAVTFC